MLVDFCGCVPEIMIYSNSHRSIRKGLLANVVTDEGCKMCPGFVVIMKTLPTKLSKETMEIMSNLDILKKLHDECQLKSRTSADSFDKLSMPKDFDIKREISTELRRSEFTPRKCYQTMNTEVHAEIRKKQKYFFIQKDLHEIIKSRTEYFIESFKKAAKKSFFEN